MYFLDNENNSNKKCHCNWCVWRNRTRGGKKVGKDGFAICVHYAGNPAKAESVVDEINNAGGKAVPVQADVAKAADVENLFKQTLEAFDKVDVVVHSAGIMPLLPISGGNVETFDKVIATNLRGTFLVLGQAAQHVPAGE